MKAYLFFMMISAVNKQISPMGLSETAKAKPDNISSSSSQQKSPVLSMNFNLGKKLGFQEIIKAFPDFQGLLFEAESLGLLSVKGQISSAENVIETMTNSIHTSQLLRLAGNSNELQFKHGTEKFLSSRGINSAFSAKSFVNEAEESAARRQFSVVAALGSLIAGPKFSKDILMGAVFNTQKLPPLKELIATKRQQDEMISVYANYLKKNPQYEKSLAPSLIPSLKADYKNLIITNTSEVSLKAIIESLRKNPQYENKFLAASSQKISGNNFQVNLKAFFENLKKDPEKVFEPEQIVNFIEPNSEKLPESVYEGDYWKGFATFESILLDWNGLENESKKLNTQKSISVEA